MAYNNVALYNFMNINFDKRSSFFKDFLITKPPTPLFKYRSVNFLREKHKINLLFSQHKDNETIHQQPLKPSQYLLMKQRLKQYLIYQSSDKKIKEYGHQTDKMIPNSKFVKLITKRKDNNSFLIKKGSSFFKKAAYNTTTNDHFKTESTNSIKYINFNHALDNYKHQNYQHNSQNITQSQIYSKSQKMFKRSGITIQKCNLKESQLQNRLQTQIQQNLKDSSHRYVYLNSKFNKKKNQSKTIKVNKHFGKGYVNKFQQPSKQKGRVDIEVEDNDEMPVQFQVNRPFFVKQGIPSDTLLRLKIQRQKALNISGYNPLFFKKVRKRINADDGKTFVINLRKKLHNESSDDSNHKQKINKFLRSKTQLVYNRSNWQDSIYSKLQPWPTTPQALQNIFY